MQFLFALAALVVSYVVKAIATPAPEKPKPALFSDFDLPTTEEGTPQAVVFGDCWTKDWTVLWYGNYRSSPIKSNGNKK